MTRLRFIAVVLWLLASSALGAYPIDSCCRVANNLGYEIAFGSGALIGESEKSAIVLSCAHIFADEKMTQKTIGAVTLRFPKTGRVDGSVLAVDLQRDLSAIKIARIDGLRPIPVRSLAKSDAPFTAVGYPGDAGLRKYQSKSFMGRNDSGESIFQHPCYHGFSGGPMLNRYGEQIGVLIATGPSGKDQFGRTLKPTYTVAVTGDSLVNFVRQWVKEAK